MSPKTKKELPPVSLFQLCLFEQVRHDKLRGKTHFAHFSGLPATKSHAIYDRLGRMVRKIGPDLFDSGEPYTKSALDYRIVHELGLMSKEARNVGSQMACFFTFPAMDDGEFVLFDLANDNDVMGNPPSPCFQFGNLLNGMLDIVTLTTRVRDGQHVQIDDIYSNWRDGNRSFTQPPQQGFADVLKLGEELNEAQSRLPSPEQIAAVKISLTDEMIIAAHKILQRNGFTPDLVEALMSKNAHARLEASQSKRKGTQPISSAT